MPGPFGSNLQVVGLLGEGSFSKVFKLQDTRTGRVLAVKKLKKRFRSIDEAHRLPEITVLKALQGHPNIVKLEDVLFDTQRGTLALVFECLDVNLYELIDRHRKPFNERTSVVIVYQLLKAIAHMHSLNMFHRDIKPENCMINKETMELKLVDFGSTRQTTARGPFTEYVSTRWYRAPECILTAGSYGPAVDVWAVGCILFEVLTSKPLFPGKHELDQICRINNVLGTPAKELMKTFKQNPNTHINFSFPPRLAQDFRELLPDAHPAIIDLMSQMLVYNPIDRITAAGALDHPVFAKMRKNEAQWEQSRMGIPLSVYLMSSNKVNKTRQSKTQPVHQMPVPTNTHNQIQQPTVQQVMPKPADVRKAAADRINTYNRKHIVPKKNSNPMEKKPRIICAAKTIQKPGIVLPELTTGLPFRKRKEVNPLPPLQSL